MGHTHTPDIIVDPDPHFTINTTTRAITKAEDNKKISLIQYDHNSERFSFDIDRMVEGHDVMDCNRIQIHFINIDGSNRSKRNIGLYSVDDLKVHPTNDKLATFTWLISEQATRYNGALSFLVSFSCTNEDETLYRWNSAIYSLITIAPGIDNNNTVAETYVDELLKWENYIVDNFDALEKELIETTIPAIVDERYIERDFATSEEVAGIFSLSTDDVEIPDFTNLENGAGNYSLRQVFKDGETDYSAQATGKNAAAFGGKRYDKLSDTDRTSTSAEGNQSFAAGGSTHAIGDFSATFGKDSIARQRATFATGSSKAGMTEDAFNSFFWDSKNNVALHGGQGKDADSNILDFTGAKYVNSFAFSAALGCDCIASAPRSFAAGDNAKATNTGAISLGGRTIASGANAFAANSDVTASGDNATAFGGQSTLARGAGAFAIGFDNEATGRCSFAGGLFETRSESKASFAFGEHAWAFAEHCVAIGAYLESKSKGQFSCGYYNLWVEDALFMLGNGNNLQRKNAFTVMKDGRAKVQSAPTESNDVVRLGDLNSAISAAITTALSTEV